MPGSSWSGILPLLLLAGCAGTPSEFAALDDNRDGYLNTEEGSRHEAVVEHWQALDRNLDGRVSAAEFSAMEVRPASQGDR